MGKSFSPQKETSERCPAQQLQGPSLNCLRGIKLPTCISHAAQGLCATFVSTDKEALGFLGVGNLFFNSIQLQKELLVLSTGSPSLQGSSGSNTSKRGIDLLCGATVPRRVQTAFYCTPRKQEKRLMPQEGSSCPSRRASKLVFHRWD